MQVSRLRSLTRSESPDFPQNDRSWCRGGLPGAAGGSVAPPAVEGLIFL